jgi:hypothetical protein
LNAVRRQWQGRMLACAVALLLSGRSWAEEHTRIYIYAQRDTLARSWIPISCDGEIVAEVRRGAFFAVDVSPGRHTLSLERGVPVSVDVGLGMESFVRLQWHYWTGQQPIPMLSQIGSEQASKELRFLSYAEAKRLHGKSVPKGDPRQPVEPQLKTRPER